MSYCRLSADSDVYMYWSTEGSVICFACRLQEWGESQSFSTFQAALDHLGRHRLWGEKVPECAFEDLRADISSGKEIQEVLG